MRCGANLGARGTDVPARGRSEADLPVPIGSTGQIADRPGAIRKYSRQPTGYAAAQCKKFNISNRRVSTRVDSGNSPIESVPKFIVDSR